MEAYSATFRQATGAHSKFVGRLGDVMLQLHDNLELLTNGIRVMDTMDGDLEFILGSDVFD